MGSSITSRASLAEMRIFVPNISVMTSTTCRSRRVLAGQKLRSLGHLRHVCLTVPHDIKDNIIFLVASLVTNDISAEFLGCRNRKWVETINIHESNCPWFDFYIVIDMIYIYI